MDCQFNNIELNYLLAYNHGADTIIVYRDRLGNVSYRGWTFRMPVGMVEVAANNMRDEGLVPFAAYRVTLEGMRSVYDHTFNARDDRIRASL